MALRDLAVRPSRGRSEWACLDGTGPVCVCVCLLVKTPPTPREVFCGRQECGAGKEGCESYSCFLFR